MQRLHDNFLQVLDQRIGLAGARVLEIGCGDGARTVELSKLCGSVMAIDPDEAALATAKSVHAAANVEYSIGSAEQLTAADHTFDVVLFSLSLHHVPAEAMKTAIAEAARVVTPTGRIVFIEPGIKGSFFEAEIAFDSGDGDERAEKAAAYQAIQSAEILKQEAEYYDEVTFTFDSADDFITSLSPTKNLEKVPEFLQRYEFTLVAERRINICTVITP